MSLTRPLNWLIIWLTWGRPNHWVPVRFSVAINFTVRVVSRCHFPMQTWHIGNICSTNYYFFSQKKTHWTWFKYKIGMLAPRKATRWFRLAARRKSTEISIHDVKLNLKNYSNHTYVLWLFDLQTPTILAKKNTLLSALLLRQLGEFAGL